VLITRYNYDGQIKDDEMKRVEMRDTYIISVRILEGDHMENLDIGFMIILGLIGDR
jgi:hypothetical protein